MKLYLVYLDRSKVQKKHIKIPQIGIRVSGCLLYAYTTNKKLLNSFLSVRKSIFIIKTKKISKDDMKNIDDLKNVNISNYILLGDNNSKISIAMTEQEYSECSYWLEYFSDSEKLFSYLNMFNFSILKDKYIKAIGNLGFVTMSIVTTHSDFEESLQYFDNLEYNSDKIYGEYLEVSPLNPYLLHDNKSVKIYGKSLNIFINIFKDILKEEI